MNIYRMIAGVSAFCLVQSVSAIACAQKITPQIKPSGPDPSVGSLLPLEARTVEIESQSDSLESTAQTINAGFAIAHSSQSQSVGLALDSLPLIGDLINAKGFDWGMDLPLSFNVGSVMGETGLILSTDFTMD